MVVVTRFLYALAICGFLLNFVSGDELTDLVNIHRTKLESIQDIEVKVVSITFQDGKESSRDEYSWALSGGEERLILRTQGGGEYVGEFTGLRFTLGNRDYHNGIGGFIGLKEFDGTLDRLGQLPADSLASALFNEGYPVGRGVGVDLWGQMGCYLIGLKPSSRPMWTVFQQSLVSKLEDEGLRTVSFKMDDSEFRVVIEPEKDYLISRYERKDKFGCLCFCNRKVSAG